MKRWLVIFSLLVLWTSCNKSPRETKNYIYNQYRYYGGHTDNYKVSKMGYQSISFELLDDTTYIWTTKHDSVYSLNLDTTIHKDFTFSRYFYINDSNLINSRSNIGDSLLDENYILTLVKKQKVRNRVYKIYRFDHNFIGEDGEYSLYFTKEFGIIMEYSHSWGTLIRLSEITDSENKDYLVLTEKMLDDTIFLFTEKDCLKQIPEPNICL